MNSCPDARTAVHGLCPAAGRLWVVAVVVGVRVGDLEHGGSRSELLDGLVDGHVVREDIITDRELEPMGAWRENQNDTN